MQYELFPRNDFSHKCININSVIRIFFYAYQHFLVMLLDCAVLALHTACKNSLSSYQMMGSRNSRLFKLGCTAAETGDLLMASRWEARTSPGTAEASLPARRPTWPPLLLQQSSEQHRRRNHLPHGHRCSRGARPPSLPPSLTGICCGPGSTNVANTSSIWTTTQPYNIPLTYTHSSQNFHEHCTSSEMNPNFKNIQM